MQHAQTHKCRHKRTPCRQAAALLLLPGLPSTLHPLCRSQRGRGVTHHTARWAATTPAATVATPREAPAGPCHPPPACHCPESCGSSRLTPLPSERRRLKPGPGSGQGAGASAGGLVGEGGRWPAAGWVGAAAARVADAVVALGGAAEGSTGPAATPPAASVSDAGGEGCGDSSTATPSPPPPSGFRRTCTHSPPASLLAEGLGGPVAAGAVDGGRVGLPPPAGTSGSPAAAAPEPPLPPVEARVPARAVRALAACGDVGVAAGCAAGLGWAARLGSGGRVWARGSAVGPSVVLVAAVILGSSAGSMDGRGRDARGEALVRMSCSKMVVSGLVPAPAAVGASSWGRHPARPNVQLHASRHCWQPSGSLPGRPCAAPRRNPATQGQPLAHPACWSPQ